MSESWVIGVTGASGVVYAKRLIEVFVRELPDLFLDVVVSEAAKRVFREEEGIACRLSKDLFEINSDRVSFHSNKDIGASIASGSYKSQGMLVIPCSMATLSAISHGYSANLIHRTADVTIKEKRKLILVPRETPLSVIHLENMLKLARLGVEIVPAMPGFYHQPASLDDLVDMLVMRVSDQMGYKLDLVKRWRQPRLSVMRTGSESL